MTDFSLILPFELLYRIVNLTRPLDFENIMLASRRTYIVGKSLIRDHNFCKKWATYDETGGSPNFDHPIKILDRLPSAPIRCQAWLLHYVMHSGIGYFPVSCSDCAQILEKIGRDIPWLAKQLLQLSDAFPETEQYREMDDIGGTVAAVGLDFERKDIRRGPSPEFYTISTLLLFSNVKQLAISSLPRLGSYITLPWLIKRDLGQSYFQQLEELQLQASTRTIPADISSWLLLPKLTALMVVNLTVDELVADEWDLSSYDWPFGKHESLLEHLVLLKATSRVEVVGEMLKPLKSLRTFIWEDAMHYIWPSDSSDSEDEAMSPTRELDNSTTSTYRKEGQAEGVPMERIRDEFSEPLVDSDSDEIDDTEKENIPSSLSGRIDESLLFKPRELISHLALNLHDKLEHLVLTVNLKGRLLILRQHQIIDFKAFNKLTHLEIDTSVLRTKRDCSARSLTKVMPKSIEVLRLIIREGRFENICHMLRRIPLEKSNFLNLRLIAIRFVEYGSQHEILTRIQPLQNQFRNIGICLDMHAYPDMKAMIVGEWSGCLRITLHRESDANGLSRFFQLPNW